MTDLEMLLAKDQMRERIYLYSRCMDRCDNSLCSEIFTEDCTMDYGDQYQGTARGFCEWVKPTHEKMFEMTSHQYTDVMIKFKSETEAVSEIYAIVSLFGRDGGMGCPPGKRMTLSSRGRYIDRWRKCDDGQWRICERHFCYEENGRFEITGYSGSFNTQRGKGDIVYKFFD